MSDKVKTRKKTTKKEVTSIEEAAKVLREHAKSATLEDLIPSVETEKWIVIDDPNKPDKEIKLLIKKLVMEDLSSIGKYAKEDPNDTVIATVKFGVVEPRLHMINAKAMGPKTCIKICEEILEFSDLKAEDIEAAKN